MAGCSDDVVVGLFIGLNLHELHLLEHFRDCCHFFLVAQQIYEEIKVVDRVLSLVKEGLQIGIDSLVDFSVMVLLHESEYTSYSESDLTGSFSTNARLSSLNYLSNFLPLLMGLYLDGYPMRSVFLGYLLFLLRKSVEGAWWTCDQLYNCLN